MAAKVEAGSGTVAGDSKVESVSSLDLYWGRSAYYFV